MRRSLYLCIVIFSAESSGLETAPSLAEWCKWFELCSFSLVFCSIFCLMPWSWLSERAVLERQSTQLRCTVRYLWGHNNRVTLTIFSVFALKKEGILEGYLSEIWSESPWLYSSFCIPFSSAAVCFCKAYCTFTPYASSLYSSTTNCLSVLYIVISLQPRLLHHCNGNLS